MPDKEIDVAMKQSTPGVIITIAREHRKPRKIYREYNRRKVKHSVLL